LPPSRISDYHRHVEKPTFRVGDAVVGEPIVAIHDESAGTRHLAGRCRMSSSLGYLIPIAQKSVTRHLAAREAAETTSPTSPSNRVKPILDPERT